MNKQISIIGCGWLGIPLARHLILEGYKIKGTTTFETKIPELSALGMEAYCVEITDAQVIGNIEAALRESEILILNIPPGLNKRPDMDFVKQVSHLIHYIETSSIKKVVYISSTSVFADNETIPIITENTLPNATSNAAKQLVDAESLITKNPNFQTTILRFGGLFGEDRHPATYLSGRANVQNPEAPVNLVHQLDCIGIISKVIEKNVWKDHFNVATTPHPIKKEYYTAVCKALGLAIPLFDESTPSKGKLINSDKLCRRLGYQFQVTLNN